MKGKLLSIIVPVYNEENNVGPLVETIQTILKRIRMRYEIVFVMDPCTDRTEEAILRLRQKDKAIKLLKMSRRFGQPACTMAGIQYCEGDAGVVMDADLQDPPSLIEQMVEKWQEGYHVVYAQRRTRAGENFLKRTVAYVAYWLINKISFVPIPRNTGDFRLVSREVMVELRKFREHDAFFRGLVACVGFDQYAIEYDRDPRLHGKGNYNPLFGSFRIGFNGIIGFSKVPLHMISLMGIAISGLSFLLAMIYLISKVIQLDIPWGNPTLVILVSFLSGIQLLSLGVIGQYFARIYDEIKNRPLFIVQAAYGFDNARSRKKR